MKDKKTRTTILLVILVGLVVLAYKVVFVTEDTFLSEENVGAVSEVEKMMQEIQTISFDTSVMNEKNFSSLKSFETALISLPVGRSNPFAAVGSN